MVEKQIVPGPGPGPGPGYHDPRFGHREQHHNQPQRSWKSYVPMKASTEFDSEGGVFVNKLSTNLWDGLAKLKLSFERGPNGVSYPLLGLLTKHLSVLYDTEDVNALVTLSGNLGRNLHAKVLGDIKAKQGEVQLRANGFNNMLRASVSYDIPSTGALPKASLAFPLGEIKIEEELREDEDTGDEFRELALSGLVGGQVLGGVALASYAQENINLKYTYKDREMTVTPSFHWPQNNLSLIFKRQFDAANKLSYSYNFDSTAWTGVYKHQPLENFKLKLGYDSDIRLCWGSVWVGREDSGAKNAPRKCKLQVMVQVPQDEVQNSIILFRIKKRWDL